MSIGHPVFPVHAGRAVLAVIVAVAALSSCGAPPVVWDDVAPLPTERPSPIVFPAMQPFDSTSTDGSAPSEFALTEDVLRDAGAMSMVRDVILAMPQASQTPTVKPMTAMPAMSVAPEQNLGVAEKPFDADRCPRSLRIVPAPGRGHVAVWWTRRSRGRVALVAAWQRASRSDSAGADSVASWRGPISIDTLDQGPGDANATDRGAASCARPAPGIAVDDKNGYVHVAYSLNAPEGPGVFYAHQMDPRTNFEPPLPIVYGERLGAARVAAAGDIVAVAYDDPNSARRAQVGLAVSRTAGHSFEDRMSVSASTTTARDPYVLVKGSALVVGWSEWLSSDSDAPIFRLRRATVR